jgi:hypothetical protein
MTDDDLTGDTWTEEVDDEPQIVPKMVGNSAIARSLYRDPALAEAIGREQLGLTQMGVFCINPPKGGISRFIARS